MIALIFRFAFADRIPGINGDEAEFAYRVSQWNWDWSHPLITSTGRIYSPFYTFLIALVQKFLDPSFFALRLPAILSGFAEVVLAFWLLPQAFGKRIGLSLALLMICLPGGIVQSRIGWEIGHAGILAILAVYFAWRRYAVATIAVFAVAVITHKVQVFLAPVLFIPFAWNWLENSPLALRTKLAVLGLLGALAAMLAGFLARNVPDEHGSLAQGALERLLKPWKLGPFLIHLTRLISGVDFFAGAVPLPALILIDSVSILGMLWLLWFGGKSLLKRRSDADARKRLSWITGWLASVLSLYIVAGEYGISEGHIFYILILALPTLLSLIFLSLEIFPEARLLENAQKISVVLLGITALFYFLPLLLSSSTVHPTYLTGPEEPKEAAYRWAEADFEARAPFQSSLQLITDDWWMYWPVVYLNSASPFARSAQIYHFETPRHLKLNPRFFIQSPKQLREIVENGGYVISFTGGHLESLLRQAFAAPGELDQQLTRKPIAGFGGREIISVWRLKARAVTQSLPATAASR
jgi:hypothetical protein